LHILAKLSSSLFLFFIFILPIAMDPLGSFSATNMPKLFLIVFSAALLITTTIPSLAQLYITKSFRIMTSLIVFALFWSSISLFINSENLDERIFGVYGRNLGFITFFSLFLIFWCSQFFLPKWIPAFFVSFSISSLLVASYFLLQYLGIDYGTWEQTYGKTPSSSLGNPNYVVALIALGLTLPLSFLVIQPSRSIKTKVAMFFSLAAGISCMSIADALQGYLILGFSLLLLLIFKFGSRFVLKFKLLSLKVKLLFTGFIGVTLVFVLLFLESILEKLDQATVVARLDYWQASLHMILKSPLFGLGFDSFGDYYLEFRGESAAARSVGLFSDSPHNFFFELATFAGLPLVVCYVLIQIEVLRSAKNALKKANPQYGFYLMTLITYWTGFHIQALINPSSLALLPLQFVTSGILYSYSKFVSQESFRNGIFSSPTQTMGSNSLSLIRLLSTLAVGLFLIPNSIKYGLASWEKDRNFKTAASNGDGAGMISISNDWPFVFSLSELTARTLFENNYETLGMKEVRNLVKKNPRNIRGWRLLYERSSEPSERALAIAKLKALDPFNQEYDQMKP
jgi:O-antigen ligase